MGATSTSFEKVVHLSLPRFEGGIPISGPARLASPAGEIARFANGGSYQFAVYLDFLPGGPCRGNHYHRQKTETMYLISGELEAAYLDLDTNERMDVRLVAGDMVIVQPRCVHTYKAVTYSQAVEVATHPYDNGDTVAHVILD